MKESSLIAHTFARSYLGGLDTGNTYLEDAALHLHVPEGATPKDGPSAGVTMCTALISLATGEPSLTGRVLPVGGIKEKTIAARRAGAKRLVFPAANERDYDELPSYLTEGLDVRFAASFDDVFEAAFDLDPPAADRALE